MQRLTADRLAFVAAFLLLAADAEAQTIRVDATAAHVIRSFVPAQALGAAIDRLPARETDALYAKPILDAVLSAGWGPVSYRLNTELHVEAWHWNPRGAWSDPAGRGYFVGDDTPGAPIRHSPAYGLPHRGFTRNEGTENEGFSRLDDGDVRTYWKSNPYLARAYTGEDDRRFPQWIVVDLGAPRTIDAVRIAWGAPYARRYEIQTWNGEDPIKQPAKGKWTKLVDGAGGGIVTSRLSSVSVRFLRVTMSDSSETCDSHGAADRRNCVGYAIGEIYVGRATAGGFEDLVHHAPDQSQTATYCSSVDPWHEATAAAQAAGDQSGLDLFYTSGVTRGLPAMIPVAVVYGVPEDAAHEIAYVEKRGYPIAYVELGEEADGQYMTPEHYAALYLQWAAALRRVDPKLKLGGPAFQSYNEDPPAWPDERGNTSWFARFLDYLRAHGRLGDLDFMSFEHYPYDVCRWRWEDLYDEPRLLEGLMSAYRKDGLPASVPMLATEVNIAWQSGERFVDIFGGLWLADYVGTFLRAGGTASYFFHYLPFRLGEACDKTWGTFSLHTIDERTLHIKQPLAQYFASRLVTQEWVQPGDGVHRLFPATGDLGPLVTAYAVLRPDGQWSLLLVNKDRQHPHEVRVAFRDEAGGRDLAFAGKIARWTFGAQQYVWHAKGAQGYAAPDGPPVSQLATAAPRYTLPAASITVLRGHVD